MFPLRAMAQYSLIHCSVKSIAHSCAKDSKEEEKFTYLVPDQSEGSEFREHFLSIFSTPMSTQQDVLQNVTSVCKVLSEGRVLYLPNPTW
jgi:hypothetical protein